MREVLTIENFGPIKKMSFDFKKINIFIGDQGTGKSTIAKVLTAIKNFHYLTIFDLSSDQTSQFLGHLDLVGIKSYIKKDSKIVLKSSVYNFEFVDNAANKIDYPSLDLTFNFNYIPAERNMVSVLADSLYALIEVKAELPKLFLRFGNKYQSSRKGKEEFNYQDILGINFSHKDNTDYILLPDGNQVRLSNASSGIQGSVALLTVIDSVLDTDRTNGSEGNLPILVIEEPELDCFPETQNKLVEYIIAKNSRPKGVNIYEKHNNSLKTQLLITTHSPYILTSLNNLMYVFSVGQKHYKEANKIIDDKYWINPDDVSAYMLLKDGTCQSILDKEEKLIKAEKIDGVSGFLNEQFDALLNIELKEK